MFAIFLWLKRIYHLQRIDVKRSKWRFANARSEQLSFPCGLFFAQVNQNVIGNITEKPEANACNACAHLFM